jgi:arylsulfatase A-like enzyme
MILRTVWCLSAWLVVCDLGAADDAARRPDIVFILVDDLRWDELSCMGHPVVRTTHVDRIANEGVRFRNAFATTPLCSPSRGCFLTGLYTHHHGILDNTDRSPHSHQLVTFPKLLHDAGYETAFLGKWHMGNDDTARPGFTHWACQKGQGTSLNPVLNINGEQRSFEGHTTDVLNRLACEFIAQPREAPFCLMLAHKALHPEVQQRADGSLSDGGASKFIAAQRHLRLYADAPVPRRLNVIDTLAGKPALRRKIGGLPPLSRETGTPDEEVRDRWRMLAAVDEGVGQIYNALRQAGRLDSTVFVFTSDHGYWYGEHGLSVERRLAYEEAARIPLLVRYPPLVKPGTLADEFALSIDLAPTLLDLAGVAHDTTFDGVSLRPLLAGESPANWRTSFLIEYTSDTVFPRMVTMGYQAVRTARFKYIRYAELDGMDELYDLRVDPYEVNNVIGLAAYAGPLRELQQELERLGK